MCLPDRIRKIRKDLKSHKAGKARKDKKRQMVKEQKARADERNSKNISYDRMTTRQQSLFVSNFEKLLMQEREKNLRKAEEEWKKGIFGQYQRVEGHWVPSLEVLYPEYPSYLDFRRPDNLNFDKKLIGCFVNGEWIHEPENKYTAENGVTYIPGHYEEIDPKDHKELFGWEESHMELLTNEEQIEMMGYAMHCIHYILNYDDYRVFHYASQIQGSIYMRPHPDNTNYSFDFCALWKLIFSTTLFGGQDAKTFHEYMQQFIIAYRAYEVILLAHLMKVLDLNIHYDHKGNGKKVEGELAHNIDIYGFKNNFGLDIYTNKHIPELYTYY